MASEVWTLQDAKNCFSAVVNAAMAGRPNWSHGVAKPPRWVLGVEEYERLRTALKRSKPAQHGGMLLLTCLRTTAARAR